MKIVVAYNESSDAECAVAWAAEIATATKATVDLVHAVEIPLVPSPASARIIEELLSIARDNARVKLERVASTLRARGLTVTTHERSWLAVETICERAAEIDADLIVIGQRGSKRITRLLLGTVSSEVIRLAPTSVMVTRGHPPLGPPSRVLVAIDGSADSVRACHAARELFPQAELTALHVASLESASSAAHLWDVVRAALTKIGTRVRTGDPAFEIVAEIAEQGFEVVLLGRRGLGVFDQLLLGSVSDKVVQFAACPVVIVK